MDEEASKFVAGEVSSKLEEGMMTKDWEGTNGDMGASGGEAGGAPSTHESRRKSLPWWTDTIFLLPMTDDSADTPDEELSINARSML